MSSKSRLPHCAQEGLLAFNADDGLGRFDGFELTSGGLLVLVGIALTSRGRFGSVPTTHLMEYLRNRRLEAEVRRLKKCNPRIGEQ
jgi:hypothetical protein